MSMSDCPKCWDTPCTCGYDYKDRPNDYIIDMYNMFKKIMEARGISLNTPEKKEVLFAPYIEIATPRTYKESSRKSKPKVFKKCVIPKEKYEQVQQDFNF